jgi:large subunit ribosomal protein L6
MSRIAKQPIKIPEKTEVNVSGGQVTIKGPNGQLSRTFGNEVMISVQGGEITLTPKEDITNIALWGTYASHIKNMLAGVNKSFSKELVLEGIGFKSEVSGDTLTLALGFSHPVKIKIPKTLEVTAEKNIITITGPDIEEVGRFTAFVRDQKKPEPYKGKGLRYRDEVIRRKVGKKTV